MTYRNNELDLIPKVLDTYDDAEEDVVVVDSFRTFLKKAIATANRSSAFIRNLDFLSIGALPTATRCTLIFIDCIVGVMLVLDVDNSFNGTESFSGTLSICCIIVLPGATGASSSGILLFTGDGSDDIAVTSPSPDVKPVVDIIFPSSGIVVIMIFSFYMDAMSQVVGRRVSELELMSLSLSALGVGLERKNQSQSANLSSSRWIMNSCIDDASNSDSAMVCCHVCGCRLPIVPLECRCRRSDR